MFKDYVNIYNIISVQSRNIKGDRKDGRKIVMTITKKAISKINNHCSNNPTTIITKKIYKMARARKNYIYNDKMRILVFFCLDWIEYSCRIIMIINLVPRILLPTTPHHLKLQNDHNKRQQRNWKLLLVPI